MTESDEDSVRFPRELRLLKSHDFSYVFEKPVRVVNKAFTVLVRANHLNHPRLGLAVAKKQVKLAVNRNIIKRKVRESFRLNQLKLPACDFVVMVRRDINGMNRQQMDSALTHVWQKVNKICKKS